MTAYLIKGVGAKVEVFTYTDAAAATRAAETRFLEATTIVAGEEADLMTQNGPRLAALLNFLLPPGSGTVTRFATKADGARRVWDQLVACYKDQPTESEAANSAAPELPAAPTEKGNGDMASKKKAKRAAKPRAKKAAGNGSAAIVREDSSRGKLLRLAVENPGISVKSLASRASISGEGSTTAENRVRLRLRAVAANVEGSVVTIEDGKVEFKLPKGTTLDSIFGK